MELGEKEIRFEVVDEIHVRNDGGVLGFSGDAERIHTYTQTYVYLPYSYNTHICIPCTYINRGRGREARSRNGGQGKIYLRN